jgi:hypothetical protein
MGIKGIITQHGKFRGCGFVQGFEINDHMLQIFLPIDPDHVFVSLEW